MQFKFLTALLLVGACFVQVSVAHPSNTEVQRNIIDDLIAQAKKAIEQLQKVLEKNIQNYLKEFEQLKDQVTEQAQKGIEAAKQKINEIIGDAKKQIDEIKQKAEEIGADISDCLSASETQFKELLEKFLQDELQCVQNEVDQAMKIVDEGIQMITDAFVTVQDLPEKLKACGSGLSSFTCIKDVLVETVTLEASIPVQIAKKLNEVTQFVNGLQARLEVCAITPLTGAQIDAAGIVADVAKCAADKIGEDF